METKKSKKADLKSKQTLFLEIGMVTAISFVLAAFQWSTTDIETQTFSGTLITDYEPMLIPITRPEQEKEKPVPPKKAIELIIVDNHAKVADEPIEIDTEGIDVYVEPIVLEPEAEIPEQDFYCFVDEMPQFPGGEKALMQYIAKEVKYPKMAQINGVQGRVFINFIINKQGDVVQAKVVRSADELLDKEAIRVVSNMPKWKPGMQRGRTVNVSYVVPISFRLN